MFWCWSQKPSSTVWCVPRAGVSDAELQASLDYACSQQSIDCSPIQAGGKCFEPNTVASHAAFAMNLYYQTAGQNPWNCDFSQTATLTSQNPSNHFFVFVFSIAYYKSQLHLLTSYFICLSFAGYNDCVYPGAST